MIGETLYILALFLALGTTLGLLVALHDSVERWLTRRQAVGGTRRQSGPEGGLTPPLLVPSSFKPSSFKPSSLKPSSLEPSSLIPSSSAWSPVRSPAPLARYPRRIISGRSLSGSPQATGPVTTSAVSTPTAPRTERSPSDAGAWWLAAGRDAGRR